MPAKSRELYRSPNGDRWLLIREALSDRVLVRHERGPNFGRRSRRVPEPRPWSRTTGATAANR